MSPLVPTHFPGPKARLAWGLALLATFAGAQNLTDGQIDVVSARLADSALLSWELGTRAQTILELNATEYSVFSSSSLPPPKTIPSSLASTHGIDPFFAIAHQVVANRSTANNNTSGPQAFLPDGSAGDPASIGVAVLLAEWTNQDNGKLDYAGAAKDQLDFLLNDVPRTSDGAISHRVSEVQLWSDFIYMAPPFLAYYGVLNRNRTLIAEAYNQIKLYRGHLRDDSTGMWKHVLLGADFNDPGFWCTGNGWAAAGMLRVFATMKQSEYANTFKNEQKDLSTWIKEIHDAIYPHLDNTNIFTNYPDQPATASGNFYDAACTALLASTVYRAALVTKDASHIADADRTRATLFSTNTSQPASSNSSTSLDGYAHLTTDGWLTPVVNPHSFGEQGKESPEAQAFVVQLHAGYREWVTGGSKVHNSAMRSGHVSISVMWLTLLLAGLGLMM
ncbi:hypothetical protein CVT25_004397 [Psilocybe cyanescens]|uniref:Uncharacterized protein n=1 Tax=Psilocybe cyanescens TaxID=93625 RepID=A0A409XVY1_PSICY|nr:hypothetical protein CVT25_004397 [Psilocybe cyanescens]